MVDKVGSMLLMQVKFMMSNHGITNHGGILFRNFRDGESWYGDGKGSVAITGTPQHHHHVKGNPAYQSGDAHRWYGTCDFQASNGRAFAWRLHAFHVGEQL